MLIRLGQAKPKFMAVLDLSHGYWQMGLAEESATIQRS
jgi:hypothetical protein